jgi:hypothetical protein
MTKRAMVFTLCLILAGCGLFDSGTPWKGGPYKLVWIDDPKAVTLSYDAGKGASIPRVEEQVYSVGYDGRYVVAKQHPNRDKRITNYFIVDAAKDSKMANNKDVVIGPLNEEEFKTKSKELNLPAFMKTLESLK